jgi:aminoglycoside phosphotransferase (APT) family kinase protein
VVDEIRALLARHLPGYEVQSVTSLGGGLDNLVYEVNGELVVRRSRETDPAERGQLVRREAALLNMVREVSPLPVPEVAFADTAAGVLAYAKLPGYPLNERQVTDTERLATQLGEFLGRLHGAPLDAMSTIVPLDTEPLAAWLRDVEKCYEKVAMLIPAETRPLVERFLAESPPAEAQTAVFCHNDLGSEHVLVDAEGSMVTGVIDWTDAAITDPAYDLGLIYRDLGPEFLDSVLANYAGKWVEADLGRVVFYARCGVLEDIAYGVESGARRYADAGLAHLPWIFG